VSRLDQIISVSRRIVEYRGVNLCVFFGKKRESFSLFIVWRDRGFSEAEIASKVNTAERDVHSCIAWLLRFLNLADRGQLIQYASRRAPRLAL
jgi:hypothetical protein